MFTRIRTLLGVLILAMSSLSVQAAEYKSVEEFREPCLYTGRIDLGCIKKNLNINKVFMSVNSSWESPINWIWARTMLPLYVPNAKEWIVVLEGFAGKGYNDIATFAEIYLNQGATSILIGEDSPGGRDEYAIAVSEVYKTNMRHEGFENARDYFVSKDISKDISKSIHIQSGPMNTFARLHREKKDAGLRFAEMVKLNVPNVNKTYKRLFKEVPKVLVAFVQNSYSLTSPWNDPVPNLAPEGKKEKYVNNIKDEGYFVEFFNKLKHTELKPTGKTLADLMIRQQELLADAYVDDCIKEYIKENPRKPINLESAKRDLISKLGRLLRTGALNQLRLQDEIVATYGFDEFKLNRLIDDARGGLKLTISMIYPLITYFISKVGGQAMFDIGEVEYDEIQHMGNTDRFVVKYKPKAQVQRPRPFGYRQKLGTVDRFWGALQFFADNFPAPAEVVADQAPQAPMEVEAQPVVAPAADLPPPYVDRLN